MRLADCLPLLASPDTGRALRLDAGELVTEDGIERFPILACLPILFPARLTSCFNGWQLEIPSDKQAEPLYNYVHTGAAKQRLAIEALNEPDPWRRIHQQRARDFLSDLAGSVLDVGCGDPEQSRHIFPAESSYLGIDVFAGKPAGFRLVGFAEKLPVASHSFDHVAFLTSLDHILDWRQAIQEAKRVLRPGGSLVVASLVWHRDADLLYDTKHFHHFRHSDLSSIAEDLTDVVSQTFSWKGDTHREVVYLRGTKPRHEQWLRSVDSRSTQAMPAAAAEDD